MNIDLLKENFNIELCSRENSFDKICVDPSNLLLVLESLKNFPEYDFDRLTQIIAIDNKENIELIYDLYSTANAQFVRVRVELDGSLPKVNSVVEIYKSAYFDECEIFDMFGVDFVNNPKLKRLYLPHGWVGHPLRKDYVQNDERLAWNKDNGGASE